MPIRRRGDGKIVDEETRPVRGREHEDGPTTPAPGADRDTEPTYRIGGVPARESLFGDDQGRDWDSPTEPIRAPGERAPEADEGKTRVFKANRRPRPGDADVAARQDDPMADPPVGWLVVVGGPGKGRVLTLGNGMNTIGRSASSRVRLDFGDENVSRQNHARLIYEPRQRRWLLGHGDGTNLTYLNGDLVVDVVEIQAGAEIQLGETTLRFQAFCSKEFDWQDVDD